MLKAKAMLLALGIEWFKNLRALSFRKLKKANRFLHIIDHSEHVM
jgi:hypothetical protein